MSEWPAPRSGRFTLWNVPYVTIRYEGMWDLEKVGHFVKKKNILSRPGIEPPFSGFQPVAWSLYGLRDTGSPRCLLTSFISALVDTVLHDWTVPSQCHVEVDRSCQSGHCPSRWKGRNHWRQYQVIFNICHTFQTSQIITIQQLALILASKKWEIGLRYQVLSVMFGLPYDTH